MIAAITGTIRRKEEEEEDEEEKKKEVFFHKLTFRFGFGIDAAVGVAIGASVGAASVERGRVHLRASYEWFRSSRRFGKRTNRLSDELVFGFFVGVDRSRGTFQLRRRV